jgi:hypothetical protein
MNNIDMVAKKPQYNKELLKTVITELQKLPLRSEVMDKLEFVHVFFTWLSIIIYYDSSSIIIFSIKNI